MSNLNFKVGDVNDKLSLAHAIDKGYRFRLDDDGSVEIQNPEGTFYYLHNFTCSCPDKCLRGGSYQGHCKHEIYISQMVPCDWCKGVMLLGEYKPGLGPLFDDLNVPLAAIFKARTESFVSASISKNRSRGRHKRRYR